ncbi:Ohr subfamily peroxiredoxin [Kineococcus radiotolerans]|uniref:OsmC family protein n=2 Tax=Kineococcus radiotolerans TaxID=131568 RepID=A6WD98_KINRD|nr:organic hydroperoxide resistance protein [Kineococcus radiotolerans]ABS04787.1 OsmC family protein [Kineococcus radiotolerans SRS30216 = ATCC BAA-149]MBB2901630.1 Ohr subfamily peroxiredoxin [Kineococcus radiotolerans]
MATMYEATATAWGGREGRVTSSDDRLDVSLSLPRGMGGDDGPGTNPEQMFAAGYAACFHSALKGVARMRKVDVSDSAVSVTVAVTGGMAEGIDLAVRIEAQLPGLEEPVARDLLDAAHQVCPYSRATRGNVVQELVLVSDED